LILVSHRANLVATVVCETHPELQVLNYRGMSRSAVVLLTRLGMKPRHSDKYAGNRVRGQDHWGFAGFG
jgi:hypothetical protein